MESLRFCPEDVFKPLRRDGSGRLAVLQRLFGDFDEWETLDSIDAFRECSVGCREAGRARWFNDEIIWTL